MVNVHVLAKRITPAHISLMAWTPKINSSTQCRVKTKESNTQGKYSVATKSLNQGDIALNEVPFIRQLNRDLYKSNCYYCFKQLPKLHFTCHVKSCRWKIKYCSRICEERGWSLCHSWLCRFPELDKDQYKDILFALEGYIVSRSKGSNTIPELVSNLDLHNAYQIEEYEEKIQSISPLFYLSDHSVQSLKIILAQVRCNSFAVKRAAFIPVNSSFVVSRESIHLGQAVYLTASKFNHACDPGALVVFGSNDDPCQLQIQCTKEKITAGQEVTISYGPLATKHGVGERKRKLKFEYFFDCNCDSCCTMTSSSGGNSPNSIYKCQICKTGRLYRQQDKCKECGQTPYWPHYIKTEAEIDRFTKKGEYLEALQLQEGIYHRNTLKLGKAYDKLAQIYCVNNQMNMAAKYSLKSLEVIQKVYGKVSIEAAEEMMKLSTLLFNSQQKPAALKQINATMILYKILGLDKSAPEDIEELEEMRTYLMFMAR